MHHVNFLQPHQRGVQHFSLPEYSENSGKCISITLSTHAEAKAVITEEFKDITNNDIHILEAIGIEEPKSMSRIAGELHVTVGTLTTNMNSLERKGYLTRNRSTRDKRVVLVTLTEKGRKAFFHHRDFHRKMIHTIIRDLDEEEMKTLIKCLGKLDIFFREGNEE